jgi:hypothetical protein
MQILRNLVPIAGVVCATLLAASAASAQTKCFEGKTASGACVDVSLGSIMRQNVRVFTQPRLSYSGAAIAPSDDRRYDALRNWGQGLMREVYGPCVAVGQLQPCP